MIQADCQRGSPTHHPTEETRRVVKELYSAGIPRERIAKRFDIDLNTLEIHYRPELDEAKDCMTSTLGTGLYMDALNGDQGAREFWLKCQGRWSYAKPPEDSEKDKQQLSLMEKLIDKL